MKKLLPIALALALASCGSTPSTTNPRQSTPPSFSVNASNTNFTSPGTLVLTANATTSVREVNFYQGTTLLRKDVAAPYELLVDINDASQNGTHTYTVEVVDAQGNASRKTVTVTVALPTTPTEDTTPPTATMIVNKYEFTQAGTLNMTVDATDASGIAKVQFFLGEQLISEDTTAPYEATYEFKNAKQNGSHTFRAWVTDTKGNPAEVKTTVTVNIKADTPPPPKDATPPTVTLKASKETVTESSTVKLTATAQDESGIAKVEFLLGDEVFKTLTQEPYEHTLTFTGHQDNCTYTYTVRATDKEGNKAEKKVTVTVNIPEPAPDPEPDPANTSSS